MRIHFSLYAAQFYLAASLSNKSAIKLAYLALLKKIKLSAMLKRGYSKSFVLRQRKCLSLQPDQHSKPARDALFSAEGIKSAAAFFVGAVIALRADAR